MQAVTHENAISILDYFGSSRICVRASFDVVIQ